MIRRPPRSTLFPLHDALPIYSCTPSHRPHPLRLQFDQILYLDRLTAAFDAVTGGDSNQAGKSAVAQTGAQIQRIRILCSAKNQILYRAVGSPMAPSPRLLQVLYDFGFAKAARQADFVVAESVRFDLG